MLRSLAGALCSDDPCAREVAAGGLGDVGDDVLRFAGLHDLEGRDVEIVSERGRQGLKLKRV